MTRFVRLPEVADGFVSSWAQYTVQLPEGIDRAKLQEQMKKEGIPTMVYYLRPMHSQGRSRKRTVLSLPMHPFLTGDVVKKVAETLVSSM